MNSRGTHGPDWKIKAWKKMTLQKDTRHNCVLYASLFVSAFGVINAETSRNIIVLDFLVIEQ